MPKWISLTLLPIASVVVCSCVNVRISTLQATSVTPVEKRWHTAGPLPYRQATQLRLTRTELDTKYFVASLYIYISHTKAQLASVGNSSCVGGTKTVDSALCSLWTTHAACTEFGVSFYVRKERLALYADVFKINKEQSRVAREVSVNMTFHSRNMGWCLVLKRCNNSSTVEMFTSLKKRGQINSSHPRKHWKLAICMDGLWHPVLYRNKNWCQSWWNFSDAVHLSVLGSTVVLPM